MEFGGYAGKILKVNLTTGLIEKEPLNMKLVDKFIGPEGILFRLAFDLMPPKMNPLSEKNIIIYGAGPIVGTSVPTSSRYFALFKNPNYGGTIETSHAGGDLGPMFKKAGFDYVIITGKSEIPVYLNISDNNAELRDAEDLWGKDTYETTDILWKRHDHASVHTMGPAGERLVAVTVGLVDKVHTLGKGGLPAVMGSKKLKAVVVKGTQKVRVMDPERLKGIVVPLMKQSKNHPMLEKQLDLGTMGGLSNWFEIHGASSENWASTFPVEEAYKMFDTEIYKKNFKGKRIACPSCPAGCKDLLQIKEGEFAGLETYASSFLGRLENFAARCNIRSFNRILKCIDYCQRSSLCIHEVTALIDWAVDLFKRGIIDIKVTGGLELEWDYETTITLLKQMSEVEGFGAILGEGLLSAITKIGRESEERAIHVKGMPPLYDPRINRMSTAEFAQVVYSKGAHPGRAPRAPLYMSRDLPNVDLVAREWAESNCIPEDAIGRIFDLPGRFNIGRLTKWCEENTLIFNTLGFGCGRERGGISYTLKDAVEIYMAVTGLEITPEKLLEVASRSYDLIKVLNQREGFTRKDDRFPDRWFEPAMRHGKETYLEDYFHTPLNHEDCEKILDDYYDERGWDIKRGTPTKEKLLSNGLEDITGSL